MKLDVYVRMFVQVCVATSFVHDRRRSTGMQKKQSSAGQPTRHQRSSDFQFWNAVLVCARVPACVCEVSVDGGNGGGGKRFPARLLGAQCCGAEAAAATQPPSQPATDEKSTHACAHVLVLAEQIQTSIRGPLPRWACCGCRWAVDQGVIGGAKLSSSRSPPSHQRLARLNRTIGAFSPAQGCFLCFGSVFCSPRVA